MLIIPGQHICLPCSSWPDRQRDKRRGGRWLRGASRWTSRRRPRCSAEAGGPPLCSGTCSRSEKIKQVLETFESWLPGLCLEFDNLRPQRPLGRNTPGHQRFSRLFYFHTFSLSFSPLIAISYTWNLSGFVFLVLVLNLAGVAFYF